MVSVDTREVQPHDASEKEQLGLASVKAEPGSTGTTTTTTGTRLLHGILSQHPQQHGLGVQNGYGRHLPGHAQMGQPSYTTATMATTSTPGQPRPSSLMYFNIAHLLWHTMTQKKRVCICNENIYSFEWIRIEIRLDDRKNKIFLNDSLQRMRLYY